MRDFAPDLKFEIGNLERSHCAIAFTSEGTEDTETEKASRDRATDLRGFAPEWKLEL